MKRILVYVGATLLCAAALALWQWHRFAPPGMEVQQTTSPLEELRKNPNLVFVRAKTKPNKANQLEAWKPELADSTDIILTLPGRTIVASPELGVRLYNQEGTRMMFISYFGNGPTDVQRPVDMIIGNGVLYVADAVLCRVLMFNASTFAYVGTMVFDAGAKPDSLYIVGGKVMISLESGSHNAVMADR